MFLVCPTMIRLHFSLRLEIEGNKKIWKQDQRIRLRHVDTSGYLHSHDKKYSRIAGGQQEVILNSSLSLQMYFKSPPST